MIKHITSLDKGCTKAYIRIGTLGASTQRGERNVVHEIANPPEYFCHRVATALKGGDLHLKQGTIQDPDIAGTLLELQSHAKA